MRLTKQHLKQIIDETIDEMRIGPVAGHSRYQGDSIPAKNEIPSELEALLGAEFAHLETELDEEKGWVVYFSTSDNTSWGIDGNEPEGWTVDKISSGAHDGDETYMMYKTIRR